MDAFQPSCIANSTAESKDQVLREIADLVADSGALRAYTADELYEALRNRESVGSTGFENGIAIPHCSLENAESFVAGVLMAPQGVPFESVDGGPTRLFVFIAGPKSERNRHIGLISAVSRMLIEPSIVDRIVSAGAPAEVMRILKEKLEVHTGDDTERSKPMNLLTIFVQQQAVFDDILRILTASVHSSIMVVEATNAGSYLDRLPLFSTYWTDTKSRFNRIIQAVIDRDLSNDTIRRIGAIPGAAGSGVLTTVQELIYAGGVIDY